MAAHTLRLGLILSLSLLWFFANTEQVLACSCVPPDSPREELARSAAVFSGKVMHIREYHDPNSTTISSTDPTTVAFEVDAVWKGHSYATAYFTTARFDASCGFNFVEGEEYIVYSHNGFSVSVCSRTALLKNAEADLDELGEGHKPEPGTKGPIPGTPEFPSQQSPDIEWVEPASGGCSLDSATSDAAWLGIIAGLVWVGVRRRPRS